MRTLLALEHQLAIPVVEGQSGVAGGIDFTDGPGHFARDYAFTLGGFEDEGFAHFNILLGTFAHLIFTLALKSEEQGQIRCVCRTAD